jgi:hypothetical protein
LELVLGVESSAPGLESAPLLESAPVFALAPVDVVGVGVTAAPLGDVLGDGVVDGAVVA